MNFTDRDTYLQARADWKLNYARISHEIRLARSFLKSSNRTLSIIERSTSLDQLYPAIKTLNSDRRDLYKLRDEANLALVELCNAKEEANRQWELKHSVNIV
jgi:hypothetical protein